MEKVLRIVGVIIAGVIVMMVVVLTHGPSVAAWAQGYLGQQGSVGVITITGLIALVLCFDQPRRPQNAAKQSEQVLGGDV